MKKVPETTPSNRRLIFSAISFALVLILIAVYALWRPQSTADEFTRLMNVGKNYYDQGETGRAIDAFQRAVALQREHPDAHLNLANSYLLAGEPEEAARHAEEVLSLDPHSAAAHYVKGCAHMRLGEYEEALQSLQTSAQLEPWIAPVHFQLGLAHQHLRQWEAAIEEFMQVTDLDMDHPAVYYNLSQVLIRTGREEEAADYLAIHQEIASRTPVGAADPARFERSKHTEARVPFKLEQPDKNGIQVAFVDVTEMAFGAAGENAGFHGPVGIMDIGHRGRNDLFVTEGGDGFRLLLNQGGKFEISGARMPGIPGAGYARVLAGNLQNGEQIGGRQEHALALGPQGTHVFRFSTNGLATDVTAFTRLGDLQAVDGVLLDLDFTGKLDLVAITEANQITVWRNDGHMAFTDRTETSGVPVSAVGARQIVADDWNNDDLTDLFVTVEGQAPMLLIKERGGPLMPTNWPSVIPPTRKLVVGDLNNDLRNDLVLATATEIECFFGGTEERVSFTHGLKAVTSLALVDYDNDGWLDIIAGGETLRIWRNLGRDGFQEMSRELGVDQFQFASVDGIKAADFHGEGATDLLLEVTTDGGGGKGLRLLRNQGGNANNQMKVRLVGNRSNASGLGARVEVTAGGLRLARTLSQLPMEIGVGKHESLDSLTVRWVDLAMPLVDVEVDPKSTLAVMELILPTGSCPYLYVWDGTKFRFVTDLLGSAPLGLRLTDDFFIEANPFEHVWIGDETNFQPRGGEYVLQITEELREVLYLDEAKLVVVDHPPGTEVHSMDKLLPGKPFPPSGLMTLHHRKPLLHAERHDGLEVTEILQEQDGKKVSPIQLRAPQLRGLAEPFSVTLDFGPLETEKPLVLAMTGWLHFGGGMANVGASHHPDLPFPFPTLEVELAHGAWEPVDVQVGAPAGKTKSLVVDLTDKLPPSSKRLRLTTAFEIHWDRIALFERREEGDTIITALAPTRSDLHWRGFSEFKDLPRYFPLTPDYEQVRQTANWRITPAGWCTRYGPVDELLAETDDALVLLNGGDELTLNFAVGALPDKPAGTVRNFFLYSVGWDKDADFHVENGWTVGPLPFHGMDDQLYGKQSRPASLRTDWIEQYNTRWVGPYTVPRPEIR
jgi:tetratricopeptide (TPR) repeat protein